LGLTPPAVNGGKSEVLHGLIKEETSPGKKANANANRERKAKIGRARLINFSTTCNLDELPG